MSYEFNDQQEPLVLEKAAEPKRNKIKSLAFALLASLAFLFAGLFGAACLTATAVTLYVFVVAPHTIINFGPFLLGSLAGSGIGAYHLGKLGIHYLDGVRLK